MSQTTVHFWHFRHCEEEHLVKFHAREGSGIQVTSWVWLFQRNCKIKPCIRRGFVSSFLVSRQQTGASPLWVWISCNRAARLHIVAYQAFVSTAGRGGGQSQQICSNLLTFKTSDWKNSQAKKSLKLLQLPGAFFFTSAMRNDGKKTVGQEVMRACALTQFLRSRKKTKETFFKLRPQAKAKFTCSTSSPSMENLQFLS